MNFTLIPLALLLGFAADPASTPATTPAIPQETQVGTPQQAPSAEAMVASFTKYQIAIVRKGSAWTKDAPAKIEKLTAQRGDYWKKMIDEGKLLGIAKVTDSGDIRGLLFFKIQDKDEMKKVAADAPAVKQKLLSADVRTVWGSKGLGAGAKDLMENAQQQKEGETYYLVAMTKGPKWSNKADSPETRKATSDGMKYLYELYKGGSLRWFAAFEDMSLKLRNVMILKVPSAEEAMKLVKESPTVKSGWNEPKVFEVKVPNGIIP
jgi:hypothetical protein